MSAAFTMSHRSIRLFLNCRLANRINSCWLRPVITATPLRMSQKFTGRCLAADGHTHAQVEAEFIQFVTHLVEGRVAEVANF